MKTLAENTGRDPTMSGVAHLRPDHGHVVSDMAAMQTQGCQAAAMFESGWINMMCQLNQEMTGFVSARLRDCIDTQQKLFTCRDISTWQTLQSQYAQRAFDAYAEEGQRLVDLTTRLLPAALIPGGSGDQ